MKVEVVCSECGKKEYVTQSRAKKYVCCSKNCLGKYNSKKYSKKVELICPICGEKYECKQSKINNHKTCGKKECRSEWLKRTRVGSGNNNYKSVNDLLKENNCKNAHDKSKTIYMHIVKEQFKLSSITKLPKGYVIHHKDGNHENNLPENLILIDKSTHSLIHRYFGNILIRCLHCGLITKETFFSFCNEEERKFYIQLIDTNITNQILTKDKEKTINNFKYIYYND